MILLPRMMETRRATWKVGIEGGFCAHIRVEPPSRYVATYLNNDPLSWWCGVHERLEQRPKLLRHLGRDENEKWQGSPSNPLWLWCESIHGDARIANEVWMPRSFCLDVSDAHDKHEITDQDEPLYAT